MRVWLSFHGRYLDAGPTELCFHFFPPRRYGSGLLGSLGLKERTHETSLSMDIINGSDDDDDDGDTSKDEALLPL